MNDRRGLSRAQAAREGVRRVLYCCPLLAIGAFAAMGVQEPPAGDAPRNDPEEAPAAPPVGAQPAAVPPEAPQDEPEPDANTPSSGPAGEAPAPPTVELARANTPTPVDTTGEVQISFQGVEINVIAKWLGEVTGKTVYMHKEVKGKPQILSTRRKPLREAILDVYRALALEGFTAVETPDMIYIVPESMEDKIQPGVVDGDEALAGKQILVKVFDLEHARAEDLPDKIRGVLSKKGRVDVEASTNRVIVTDYADNLRLLVELVAELDVPASSDSLPEIIPLKFMQADQLASILTSIFSGSTAAVAKSGGETPKQPAAAGDTQSVVIRFLADKVANRLIVTAPNDKLAEIKALVMALDVAKPVDVSVRVIPLEFVDAEELVREIAPMYSKLRGETVKDTIEIAANERSNSVIVLSSEANYEAIRQLVKALDTSDAEEKLMESFPLHYADAEDVAKQLEELHDTTDSNRYRYWYYSSSRRDDREQTRFVANRRRNEVVVIGSKATIERVGELIKRLDEPVGEEALAPRIYTLKFVSSFDVETVLNELFLKKREQRPYWWDDYGEEEDVRDVGRLYGKVRIASEPYTNSIIATTNSEENFAAVENILEQLDVPPDTDTTLTVSMRHANALKIANNINVLFAEGGSPPIRGAPQQQGPQNPGNVPPGAPTSRFQLEEEVREEGYFPWLGGQREGGRTRDGRVARPVSDLVGKVRVVPDLRTNSLLITTSSYYFPQVAKVIETLDVPTPQVLIEAKIIEILKDDVERLGTRWSPDGAQVFDTDDLDDSFLGSGSATYQEIFSGSPDPDSLRLGVFDAEINLDLLVQFLRRYTQTRVRAEPRINVADNERGQLFVGSRIPFIRDSQISPEGTRNDSFEYLDVGIILEVTPHINADGDVTMRVRVESSQVRPGVTLFGGAIIDTRNYQTEMTVGNRQVLVLGGIIRREETEVERKIPILGDIPLLGYLFKKKDTKAEDVELMVFLRPIVTRSVAEVEELMEEETEKTPHVQEWDRELEERDAKRSTEAGE